MLSSLSGQPVRKQSNELPALLLVFRRNGMLFCSTFLQISKEPRVEGETPGTRTVVNILRTELLQARRWFPMIHNALKNRTKQKSSSCHVTPTAHSLPGHSAYPYPHPGRGRRAQTVGCSTRNLFPLDSPRLVPSIRFSRCFCTETKAALTS